MLRRIQFALLVFAVGMIFSGCNSLKSKSISKSISNPFTKQSESKKDPSFGEPMKLITIWKDAIATNDRGISMRGFAGRVYFLDKQDNLLKVNGDVTVYGFDDSKGDDRKREPDQKVTYTANQLSGIYSESRMGHSYSLWVPWDDNLSGYEKDVTLLTLFKNESGRVIKSEVIKANLPGEKDPSLEFRSDFFNHFQRSMSESKGIHKVAHIQEQMGQDGQRKMETTTIGLSSNLRQKLIEMTRNGELAIQKTDQATPQPQTQSSMISTNAVQTELPTPTPTQPVQSNAKELPNSTTDAAPNSSAGSETSQPPISSSFNQLSVDRLISNRPSSRFNRVKPIGSSREK